MAKIDDAPTAANSAISQTKEGPRTRRTVQLTAQDALDILVSALNYCREAGMTVKIMPLYENGCKSVGLVIDGVLFENNELIASTGTGGTNG